MSQKQYMFLTMFFLLALLVLTSAAWHEFVLGHYSSLAPVL